MKLSILHNATENSLIILDEIGRGTSTLTVFYCLSVAEYLQPHKAKTLFATHYHVMNKLAEKFPSKIIISLPKSRKGEAIFLHKLIEGG